MMVGEERGIIYVEGVPTQLVEEGYYTQQSIRRTIEADDDNDDDVDNDKDNSIGNGGNTKPNVAMVGDHKCN